ncbi:MAG TPA: hypothetical protein PK156_02990 [Polyangium sp.]|nr:hypothetical protein [Polyangium sp.]
MPDTKENTKVVTSDPNRAEEKRRRINKLKKKKKDQEKHKDKPSVKFNRKQKQEVKAQTNRLKKIKKLPFDTAKYGSLKDFAKSTLRKFRFALPPPPPRMKEDAAGASKDPPKIDATSCLVHGMKVEFVADALMRGKLSSSFTRNGLAGNYFRKDDRSGGGCSAVYTRAVGTEQDTALAHGYGVGSAPLSCVQFIMSPTVLEDPDHVWRASTADRKGKLPGVTEGQRMNDKVLSPKKIKELWEQQSPAERTKIFNDTVTARPPVNSQDKSSIESNEQMHYQSLPLENSLKAIVASSDETFNALMKMPGAHLDPDNAPHGIVMMGDKPIRVLKATDKTKLLDLLKQQNIADKTTGQVR